MLYNNRSLKIMWDPWSHDSLTAFLTLEQLQNGKQSQILFVFLLYCVYEWESAPLLPLGCVYYVKEVYAVWESLSTVYVSEFDFQATGKVTASSLVVLSLIRWAEVTNLPTLCPILFMTVIIWHFIFISVGQKIMNSTVLCIVLPFISQLQCCL